MADKLGLSGSLAYFASQNSSQSFDNPFEESEVEYNVISESEVRRVIDQDTEMRAEKKKRTKKKDKFARIIERGSSFVDQFAEDELTYDFDGYLSGYLLDDEDAIMKNNLVTLGRKYARDTRTSAESSEVTKAYFVQEKALEALLNEIEKDKASLQKDIDGMRVCRSRNFKTMGELISTKAQYHNMALGVIKEKNAITKVQFDLQMKKQKDKDAEGSNDATASRAIQQLFGMGRNNIMSGVGGYEGVSGAITEGAAIESQDDYGIDDDAMIQQRYFNNDDNESDGDKFLRYENMGVEYILLWDKETNNKEVLAEDKDGNLIPDYPMPNNIETLNFDISESTGTATDDLHRTYRLRVM